MVTIISHGDQYGNQKQAGIHGMLGWGIQDTIVRIPEQGKQLTFFFLLACFFQYLQEVTVESCVTTENGDEIKVPV